LCFTNVHCFFWREMLIFAGKHFSPSPINIYRGRREMFV
jgi:hypothetical protein